MKKPVKITLSVILGIVLTTLSLGGLYHLFTGNKKPTTMITVSGHTLSHRDIDGIDVSGHQGNIDWGKVSKNLPDNAFVYIKCTEGATFIDPMCKKNATEARKRGLHIGGYHFFRMTSSAHDQFKNFKKALSAVPFDLIPMVDIEVHDNRPKKEIQDSLQVLLNLLEKEYKVRPMIYGTQRSYNTYCAPRFNSYPLYVGRYGSNAPIVKGHSHYTIWQYTESGELPGINKKVDFCRFHRDAGLDDILMK